MLDRVFEGCHFSTKPNLFQSFKEVPVAWKTQLAKKGCVPDKVYIIFRGLVKLSVTQLKEVAKQEPPLMLHRRPPVTKPIKILGPDHLIGLEEAKNGTEFDYDVFVEERDTLVYSIDAGLLFSLASQDYGLFKRIDQKLLESKLSSKQQKHSSTINADGDRTVLDNHATALLPDPTLSEERRNSKELESQFNVELRCKKVEEINTLLRVKEATLKQRPVLKQKLRDGWFAKEPKRYKRYINERDSINIRKKKHFSESLRKDHFEKYKSIDLRETQLTANITDSLAMTNIKSACSRYRSIQHQLNDKIELDGDSELASLQYGSRPRSCLHYSIDSQPRDLTLHRETTRDIISKILHKNFSINCLEKESNINIPCNQLYLLQGKLSKTNYHTNLQDRPHSKLISPARPKSIWDPRRKQFRKTEASSRLEFTKSFGSVPRSGTSGLEPRILHLENSLCDGLKLNEQLFR